MKLFSAQRLSCYHCHNVFVERGDPQHREFVHGYSGPYLLYTCAYDCRPTIMSGNDAIRVCTRDAEQQILAVMPK